jgi:hypothetical protein
VIAGPDLALVRAWVARYWLAVWFGIISAMRLSVLVTSSLGFDGRLYLRATQAWLAGADPWVTIGVQRFAAPPLSLVPLAPIAVLPEELGVAVMIILAGIGAIATIRLLRLPPWWLLFPPVVDGVWNGNPQVLLVPLILVSAGPVAVFLKVYALVPIVLTLRWRAVLVTAVGLALTAPILPWGAYLEQFTDLSGVLVTQSDGGLSVAAVPWLLPVAVVALVFCGRERAGWLAVPVLWPATQWYYSTLALPALTPVAAAIMAIPIPGAVVIAAAAVAIQRRNDSIARLAADWRPSSTARGRLPDRMPD